MFWGMMRFGEVSVKLCNDFDKTKHIKWWDVLFGFDQDGKHYVHLDLPSAKTAKPGEIQSVFLVPQDSLCPLEALCNLTAVVPGGPDDPLFSWHDCNGDVHPMVKTKAMYHSHQCHPQIMQLGHHIWPFIQDWQSLLLPIWKDRPWNHLYCWALVFP